MSVASHHDLMYDCWWCSLFGSFKTVEQQLGIPCQLKDIVGLDAINVMAAIPELRRPEGTGYAAKVQRRGGGESEGVEGEIGKKGIMLPLREGNGPRRRLRQMLQANMDKYNQAVSCASGRLGLVDLQDRNGKLYRIVYRAIGTTNVDLQDFCFDYVVLVNFDDTDEPSRMCYTDVVGILRDSTLTLTIRRPTPLSVTPLAFNVEVILIADCWRNYFRFTL